MVGLYPYNSSLRSILSAFIFITVFYIPATKAALSFQLFPNKPLLDGATLVSSGGIFELGFFYPGSSANRYVGIWYHNFSTSTVLWVANREFPVLDKSGSLAIAEDGNLVVLDGHKSVLWSSKVTSLHSNQSSAELLDSGNLVLKNSGAMVWQSFDHPGDTYLPGMIVGLDLVTKVNQVFTSWRSDDDPAPGNFSLGIAPDQSTQLFLWEGSKPRWRSGRWNGQVFIGIQNMVPNYTYGLKFGNFQLRGNKMYFYYSQFNSSHRYVLRPDGVVRHLVWANDTKSWYEYWAQPISQCEIYNRCGNYATCSDSPDGNSPNCTCLKGFERGSGDLSGECVRKTPLQCKRNVNGSAAGGGSALDGFYLMQGVKLPDLSDWDSSGPSNDSACEEACSTNCSCKAYSYVTGIGCLTWGRDLVDIHLFSGGGNDFYLRLAGSEFAAPSSQLSPGKPLLDGATLVSSSGIFELGFFSPGKSTSRYVGTWYYFSNSTVIWVANRDSPVLDTSGSLAIADDGNLVVLDGRKTVLWSSKVTSLKSNQFTAVLFDNGNLMLNDSGAMAWQSFDDPCDTYLPGMKVGLDLVTNMNQMFTAWRSDNDPAPGNFSLGIAPDQSTQFFIWEGGKPRWRSGRWNGQFFIGIDNLSPTYIYGFKLSNFQQEKKIYFYYTQFNITHRYVIMPDGVERHLVWDNDTKDWHQLWARPNTQCEIYNRCGNNAICSDSADINSPMCNCLKGFGLGALNLSGGCVRRTPLQCERNNVSAAAGGGEPDGFYLMQGVKLPDLSNWDSGPSTDSECKETCLTNCSCKAYSFVTGIGCLMWGGHLVDIHLFSTGGNDLYLRLAGTEFDDHKKGLKGYFIVIIVLSAVLLLSGIFLLQWKYRSRMEVFCRRHLKRQDSLVDRSRSVGGLSTGFSSVIDMHEQGKSEHNVRLFGFQTIEEATMNFCSSNLLGEGGFGPVYKGILPDGQEIAVKRLSRSSGQGMEEFKNEVILIAKLQHRNLVRLLGYCIRREDKMLVYEYMPNKSLDALLFDRSRKLQLDWKTRYNIIEGIARGLVYLHRDSRLRIIHRDLKASNILLDENMNPKISDFGMARIFGNDGNETSTQRVVGTYGYMSPEYAMNGLFSVKSDVYSFGVLLIEIVSGIRNSTYHNSEVSLNLLGYAWKLWNEDNVMELVDSCIRSSCSTWEVSKCINVGLLCIQDRANDRPTMSSVIVMLESQNSVHQMPRQPKFAAEMNRSETDSPSFDRKIVDSGNASITMLSGR